MTKRSRPGRRHRRATASDDPLRPASAQGALSKASEIPQCRWPGDGAWSARAGPEDAQWRMGALDGTCGSLTDCAGPIPPERLQLRAERASGGVVCGGHEHGGDDVAVAALPAPCGQRGDSLELHPSAHGGPATARELSGRRRCGLCWRLGSLPAPPSPPVLPGDAVQRQVRRVARMAQWWRDGRAALLHRGVAPAMTVFPAVDECK
jgi:hypothetical protein